MAVVAAGVSPDSVTVRDCMTTELITAKPDDHLEHVAALMKDNQIRRLVIIDGEGSPQGVIAIGDLFQRGDLPKEHIADILVMASIPTSQSSGPRAAMSHHSAHP
ncbi:CBS domain-containing protein [Nitrospira sp. KM1]|uniref:CBS domain-containing protein n=1 Tax=Nitrospira sp. KM1 TaxID=1936990 RepID=UPI00351A4C74